MGFTDDVTSGGRDVLIGWPLSMLIIYPEGEIRCVNPPTPPSIFGLKCFPILHSKKLGHRPCDRNAPRLRYRNFFAADDSKAVEARGVPMG